MRRSTTPLPTPSRHGSAPLRLRHQWVEGDPAWLIEGQRHLGEEEPSQSRTLVATTPEA